MKINNPDHLAGPVFFKFITVKRLMELLAQLPEDYLVNAQSMGQTGNLGVYAKYGGPLEYIIDIGHEDIEVINDHKP